MAILDFLWGSRKKRSVAKHLLDKIDPPFDRLHAMIYTAGVAMIGEGYEELVARFIDCRILHTEELADFPAGDRDELDRLVSALLPQIAAAHAEVREELDRVRREWSHGGLAEAAAGGGLRALDLLQGRNRPKTVQDRLFRIALFFDVDVACRDIQSELRHIAMAPALFW